MGFTPWDRDQLERGIRAGRSQSDTAEQRLRVRVQLGARSAQLRETPITCSAVGTYIPAVSVRTARSWALAQRAPWAPEPRDQGAGRPSLHCSPPSPNYIPGPPVDDLITTSPSSAVLHFSSPSTPSACRGVSVPDEREILFFSSPLPLLLLLLLPSHRVCERKKRGHRRSFSALFAEQYEAACLPTHRRCA